MCVTRPSEHPAALQRNYLYSSAQLVSDVPAEVARIAGRIMSAGETVGETNLVIGAPRTCAGSR